MEWYWWVLIGLAVIAIAYLKLKVFGQIMAKRKEKQAAQAALDDE